MRASRRTAVLTAAALVLSPVAVSAATAAGSGPSTTASFQPWLTEHLAGLSALTPVRVAVQGTSLEAAERAARATGLGVQQRWTKVDTVVAVGLPAQVRALAGQAGVVHVEGDMPLLPLLDTAHAATQSDLAAAELPDLDGSGVSIAVIDSGIDGTHPAFQRDGASTVVRNVKNVCGIVLVDALRDLCFADIPTNDTDTISVGGHGTHVAGIAAGVPVQTEGPVIRGSAPGAKLVGLSVGAAVGLLDAMSAQNWVLDHQQNPCRSAAAQTEDEVDLDCPPIRVTNHSYGPAASTGGNSFNESSAAVRIQRALVDRGVVAVWAAGNDGGDGSAAFTNPDAMDPTPGVLMVASYDDQQTGDRDGTVSTFSSRGRAGDQSTYPDLSAPGTRITAACRPYLVICQGSPSYGGGDFQTISGTSMASPYVAGVVAQLFTADPSLTPADVEQVLRATAHPFADGAPYESAPGGLRASFDKGAGLVDVLAALRAVAGSGAGEEPGGETPVVEEPDEDPVADEPKASPGKSGENRGKGRGRS